MDSLAIGATPPSQPQSPAKPKPAEAADAAKPASSLQQADGVNLSNSVTLKDFSSDAQTSRDEFLGYRQLWVKSGDSKDTLYGAQYGRGTDLKKYGPLRLGYEYTGTFAASSSSLHLGGDFGGKVFLGTEDTTRKFLPGMPVPIGVYATAGPSLNVTNVQGNSAIGAGVYGAVGIDVFGFNFEVREDAATNYNSLSVRGGLQIRF